MIAGFQPLNLNMWQERLILFKSLKKLHTIEMVAHDRRNPKSKVELDAWLAVAKKVLAGNEGPSGETHGGKRVKMLYSCFDSTLPTLLE